MNYRDHYKKLILEATKAGKSLTAEILARDKSSSSKTEIIWATEDLITTKDISIDHALEVAEFYLSDPDPEASDTYDKETKSGEDPRIITTVRASLCWLLKTILVQFEARYYPQVFSMIEKLAVTDTEPNAYVRRNATVPLSLITHNLRAKEKQNREPFSIDEDTKAKSVELAFRMLRENSQYPRVLEYVASVFDGLRDLDSTRAMQVLQSFFYNKQTQKLNPEYLTSHVAPLAIYFAEFRSNLKDGFDEIPFKEFLKQLIVHSDPNLKSTFIWLFWKTIEESKDSLPQLKQYINLIFEGEFQEEPAHQMEFLVEHVLPLDQQYGAELFNEFLDYILKGLRTSDKLQQKWLMIFKAGSDLEQIQKFEPSLVPGLLEKLFKIHISQASAQFNIHIGELKQYSEFLKGSDAPAHIKELIQRPLSRLPLSD